MTAFAEPYGDGAVIIANHKEEIMKKIVIGIILFICCYAFILWYSPYDANKTIGSLCAKAKIGEKTEAFQAKLDQQELNILKKRGRIEEAEYRASQVAYVSLTVATCIVSTKNGIIVEREFLPAEELFYSDEELSVP